MSSARESRTATAAREKWQLVIKNSLLRRLKTEQLEPPLKELYTQSRLPPDQIARLLLGFRARDVGADDPLLFHYAALFLRLRYIETSHLLLALLNTSRFTKRPGSDLSEERLTGLPMCEERMFLQLTQWHLDGQSITPVETHGRVFALTRWMHAVTDYEMGKQLEGGALHTADHFSFGTYEALASLVLTIFGHPSFREVAKQSWWKKRRDMIVREMENFDSHVVQWMQSQLGGRLRGLASIPPFLEMDEKGRPVLTDQQILQTISDLPILRTRAGLFIWLNACLCARPLTDDMSVLAYLQARYSGEYQALVVDLLIACFDVLTNVLLRGDAEHNIKLVRSFICNKVPSLLSMLSGFMAPPMTVDTSIQMAFMAISMDAKSPLSAGAVEARDKLKLTRTEFLQACYLHSLVSEATVTEIVQDLPVTLPKNKYSKDALLAQCNNAIGRLESLIAELDSTVGNASEIAGCVFDLLNNLCMNKDTMTLKVVCNMLIKRISSLDVILQYSSPTTLLHPLCMLLNEWVHDQDLAELTPSYEDFASILLFIYAAVHRYGLQRSDLGLSNDGNFVAKLLQERSASKPLSQLTEDESAQLGKWIEGLYGTDEHGESSGISDEVMRQCPPQVFFSLVPTLFEQSVLACKAGSLPMKVFKGGLELLVEPFLLPSLVGGLSWFVKHTWEDHDDIDVVLPVLNKLLMPSSSSADTKAMHQAILSIVAEPLRDSLEDLSKRRQKKEIGPLVDFLKSYTKTQRTLRCSHEEMMEWASTSEGGMARCIGNAIREHISWISNVGPTPPPKYTHRLFATAVTLLGPGPVLQAIVTTVEEQTKAGNGPSVFDICAAMIASPLPGSQAAPMMTMAGAQQPTSSEGVSVHDVLRLRTADAQNLLRLSATESEALVRLNRRVEAQLAVSPMPQLPMAMAMQEQATDQIMADLGLTDHAVAGSAAAASLGQSGPNAAADFDNSDLNATLGASMDLNAMSAQDIAGVMTDSSGLGVSAGDNIFDGLDLSLGGTDQTMQSLSGAGDGQDPDEDIFAGLDMTGADDDFGF